MQVLNMLGTVVEVHVRDDSDHRAEERAQMVIDEIRRLESIFNIFDAASDINDLRTHGSTETPELSEMLLLAHQWTEQTTGAFSPHVDLLRTLWTDAERLQQVPSEQRVAAVVHQLRTKRPLTSLNLNAIAKGWIVDRSIDTIMALVPHPRSCWLSIGGDVAHRGDGAITIGIEDPFRPYDNAEPMTTVRLTEQALATSGGARRYWTINDQRFNHVIDPRSGWPVDHIASASVIADNAVTADVLATAATVLRPHESLALIDTISGAACLIMEANKTVHTSALWPPALT